jgi:hypothetical protein
VRQRPDRVQIPQPVVLEPSGELEREPPSESEMV